MAPLVRVSDDHWLDFFFELLRYAIYLYLNSVGATALKTAPE